MENEVLQVYEALKNRYDLTLTTTFVLNEGFTADMPVIVAKANGLILELYDAGILVMDVMDEAQTKGTHWHPYDVDQAVDCITEFMEGRQDYPLTPFPQPPEL